jgi:hypothetical protein
MEEVTNSLAIRTGNGPMRKQLVTYDKRLETFINWPTEESGQSAQAMAEAGFYHIGISDHVKCFYCDGGLRNWEESDDPWAEHSRWFPQCPFVLLNKGRDDKKKQESKKEEVKKDDESNKEDTPKDIQKEELKVKVDEIKEEEPSTSSSASEKESIEVKVTTEKLSEADRKCKYFLIFTFKF